MAMNSGNATPTSSGALPLTTRLVGLLPAEESVQERTPETATPTDARTPQQPAPRTRSDKAFVAEDLRIHFQAVSETVTPEQVPGPSRSSDLVSIQPVTTIAPRRLAVRPVASEATRTTLARPGLTGVPEMRPSRSSSSPEGSEPDATLQR